MLLDYNFKGIWMPTDFVFCFAKCAARKRSVAFAPTHPCAGNDKKLPPKIADRNL